MIRLCNGPLETLDGLQQQGFSIWSSKPAMPLSNPEYDILSNQGAFVLPLQWLCHILLEAYFAYIAPTVPILNRGEFMQSFFSSHSEQRTFSHLLVNAVLLAGCRVCSHPCIRDGDGSTQRLSSLFYQRAKALYDAEYESDKVCVVQALTLLGWYWEGPEGIMDNSFHWTQVAITVARGLGMHRSMKNSGLPGHEKRLRKRIWWTLFCRERTLALSRGRPFTIRESDTDIEEVTADDFEELPHSREDVTVRYFLQYIKLSRLVGEILQQRQLFSKTTLTPSSSSSLRLKHKLEFEHRLHSWYDELPADLRWEPANQDIWSSILQLYYYAVLCLLYIVPTHKGTSAILARDVGSRTEQHFGLRRATTDASMISCILAKLRAFGQINFVPCFTVYSACVAMIVHANEILHPMNDEDDVDAAAHRIQLEICINALGDLSKSWLVAELCLDIASPVIDRLRTYRMVV
ncbi:uncharacterized protein TRUGW13939_03297 [Talaromyces rugulosus]|uniref:Xylanolytic transcriptional activator regulatory domain-containing protein n=1 Tax=Talaromyces rugulosus TaxID=121627 RepID=A0A7H8QQF0_TALRU|nr:uncharacterized protein TRUGW13939_03297 [Talaromyces rugulosus]QKX56197.1 hypothetical protein TRUGW13939_03297 [Talaromyces rugulosus]